MASVYAAIQESLNRPVALKVLSESFADTPEFTERFLNEGRVVASLNHRNIVTIYDIDVAANCHHYISMEYLEGGDLRQRIREGVEVDEALRLVEAIAGCLGFAHKAGVVHRDVTPANILFRQDGTPLLTDFGIARLVSSQSVLTVTGDVLGTPGYLSPERAEGKPIDGRADLYSLGVILYEMLVGARPYEADSSVATIMRHLRDPVPRLPERLEAFQPLLDRMLAKLPEERFQRAEEVLDGIRELRRSGLGAVSPREPARSPTVPRGDAAGRVIGTSRWAAIAAGALFLAVAGLGVSPDVRHAGQALFGAGGVDARSQVTQLLTHAERALAGDRLTTPPKNNAFHYYQRVLALDPGNPRATRGLVAIASRYAQLAEGSMQQSEYAKAEELIERGLKVESDDERLLALRNEVRMRTAPRRLIDNIKSLFQ